MFDIGWSELVVIGVVALIAIGPKELPGVLRMAGQWIGKIRRMAAEFQGQFQEALREAEMEDLKKQVNEISDTARDLTNFDPLASVKSEFDSVKSEFDSSFEATRIDDPAPAHTPVETGHMAPSDYGAGTAEPLLPPAPTEHVATTAESPAAPPANLAPAPADHAIAEADPLAEKAAGGHSA